MVCRLYVPSDTFVKLFLDVKAINEPNGTSEEIQGVELSTVIAIVVPMLIIIIALMVFIICIVFKRKNK